MGFTALHKSSSFERMKHSFNADDVAETYLRAAEMRLHDKTEFINRCIRHGGESIISAIAAERETEASAVLRELPAPYRAKHPKK